MPPRDRLLAVLRGHTNTVTDMKYSSAGDRLLTASIKDGNVCIWSGFHAEVIPTSFSNISKLCLQLNTASHVAHGSKVHCDGVAWTCDDLKVITSQSCPQKASGTDIIPDTQMLYVWDSHSGKCLMGINASHSSLCSALAPHPFLPSVVASAGSDGVVNVWDLDRGDCFFTHLNTLIHGPIEPSTDRGRRCGCLEVLFSPDGLNLLVTDDSGRVTILDTQVPACNQSVAEKVVMEALSEQYFANDYYELAYDENGNCIEKGSEQPPHLAPGGVRCSHEGVPVSEAMRDLFLPLKGPLPLPSYFATRCRNDIRCRGAQSALDGGLVYKCLINQVKRFATSRYSDFSTRCGSAIVVTKDGTFVQNEMINSSSQRPLGSTGYRNHKRNKSAESSLSSRYHWVDFNDLPDSDDDAEDQFDKDYHGLDESCEEDVLSTSGHRGHSLGGRGRSRRSRRLTSDDESHEHRLPSRASSRRATQHIYHELSSDDDQLQEMMSAHTKPSGKFAKDWCVSGHIFRLPRGKGSLIHRSWVQRSSYQRRKCYSPQVGDLVVYIPKAHDDTLRRFVVNDYAPPWKSWPTTTSWPVVLCKIAHARYRFPFETNYKSRIHRERLQGVSAILTLEIVGVPSPSTGRTLPWPAPTFVAPTDSRTRFSNLKPFDVTLFVSDEDDFIIPEYIYSWRLKELERAISNNDGKVDGLSVAVYCPPDHDSNGENIEDADYMIYSGRLININEPSEDEFHFSDSGYNALSLVWDTQNDSEDHNFPVSFSTWNISVVNPSCEAPVAPTMGEYVTNAIRAALRTVIRMDPNVHKWFFQHVDTAKFTDYLDMTEVPMHLSLIQMRLRSNYYTNKLSVVADMEQVKENCYKYNGDDNEFYDLACLMYEQFKSLVDAIEEPHAIAIQEHAAVVVSDGANGLELDRGIGENHTSFPTAFNPFGSGGAVLVNEEHRNQSLSDGNRSDGVKNALRRLSARARINDSSTYNEIGAQQRTTRSSGRTLMLNASSKQADIAAEKEAYSESSSEDGSDEGESYDEGNDHNEKTSHSRTNSKIVRAKKALNKQLVHHSNQQSGARRTSTRTKSLVAFAEKGSEEEEYSESHSNSESEEDSEGRESNDKVTNARVTRNSSKTPSRARYAPNKTLAMRPQPGDTDALRTSSRPKHQPMYTEIDSDVEEYNEGSDADASDEEMATDEKVSTAKRTMPLKTRGKPIDDSRQRTSLRAKREKCVGSDDSSEDECNGGKESGRNARPSRTRTKNRYLDKDLDNNAGRRTSPRGKSKKGYADIYSYAEKDSDVEEYSEGGDSDISDEEIDTGEKVSRTKRTPPRTRGKPLNNSRRRTSLRAKREESCLDYVGSDDSSEDECGGDVPDVKKESGRNTRSARTRIKPSYSEKDHDENAENQQQSGRRTSPRAKGKKLYADIDSYSESKSEGETEDDSSSGEETKSNTKKRGMHQTTASPNKRLRTQRQMTRAQKYPDLEKWGPITKRKIFSIGKAILGKMVCFTLSGIIF